MDVYIHGADSETLHGAPLSFQFFCPELRENEIIFVTPETATDEFISWCDSLPVRTSHVIYVHNLKHDLPEFFWECKEWLLSPAGDFDFTAGDWKVRGVYGAPTFCRLSNRKRNVQILIVDSHLWFQGTLAAAAELFCPHLPKLEKPAGLGSKKFTSRDTKFCAYAMRDAEIDYHIGTQVQRIVTEFDIRQPVSLANMASLIFKRRYLQYTIPQPSMAIIHAALKSYHGGKNNLVPDSAPRWHEGISSLDISSAYPYAMSKLPAFSDYSLYKRYGLARHVKSVPDFGVYCVSGRAAPCHWPSLFRHDFEPISGDFQSVWIQGFELNEALRADELKISAIRGHYYEAESDNRKPAFSDFVDDFYARKQAERDPVLRHMWKIILNALYGKFIQTRKNSRVMYTDTDASPTIVEAGDLVAGGLFHPFIASAITAQPRAYIHQIEHAHKAIHTATDGIFTREKNAIRVPFTPRGNKGLGSLQIEARGRLLLLRGKLYILYADDGKIDSEMIEGARIRKYAKHGFQGTVHDLERLAFTGSRKYSVTKPNQLRESLARGLAVNRFEERQKTLNIGEIL